MRRLVIVGGSYAALHAAAAARENGFDGEVVIASAEHHLPYQRPPLSKGLLKGDTPAADLPLKAEAFYRDQAIEVVLGQRVDCIDLYNKDIVFERGGRIGFDVLVLACGAGPRRLPAGADAGVAYLRDLEDAVRLRERLADATSVAILGGGFIGLEVASAAAAMGKQVRIVEAGPRLLARALPTEISALLAARHREAGVDIVSGAAAGVSGRTVLLTDGTTFEADLVVAGLGAVPNTTLAMDAGLAIGDGVETDAYGQTAAPGVFAVGDCSSHINLWSGRRLRLESVQNAVDQARAAGATIAGRPTPYQAAPRFWSDQYDLKLQMVGLAASADRHERIGDPAAEGISFVHLHRKDVVGVTSINDLRTQIWARRSLARGPAPRSELTFPS